MILVKFPSRSRTQKFFGCLDNIAEAFNGVSYRVLATLDIDDKSMANESVKGLLLNYPNVKAIYGTSEGKIHAVNRDMEFSGDWDIGVVMSDDMKLMPGFGKTIVEDMRQHFPEGDGVLHYPDGKTGDRIITMSILDRIYFNRFKYLYHPDYKSVYADNEFTEVAQMAGRYKFIDKDIFRHLHPAWGLGQMDEQYKHTESFYKEDKITYQRRKAKNFDL